jgi:hypothetical protein
MTMFDIIESKFSRYAVIKDNKIVSKFYWTKEKAIAMKNKLEKEQSEEIDENLKMLINSLR